MATGKKPAHDASKLLTGKKTPPKMKEVAASDLAQTPPKKTPPKRAETPFTPFGTHKKPKKS